MPASLLVEDVAPGVRALVLSNPARRNAIDPGFIEALSAALDDDAGVKVWLVRGEGTGVFSGGFDLTQLDAVDEGQPLPDERLGQVLQKLARHRLPSVALVLGKAIGGGCELAVSCDFRVGNARASFSFPPARLGIVYARAGLQRLRARVGEQVARRMFLAGLPLDAEEARAVQLLDVLADDAEERALALCQQLAASAPLAVQGMKFGFSLLDGASDEALADYELLRRQAFNSRDAREGREAMLQRRSPTFTGQ